MIQALTQALGEQDKANRQVRSVFAARPRTAAEARDAVIRRVRSAGMVIGSAVVALGQIGDVTAIPILIEVLGNPNDGRISPSAATALGRIGDSVAVPALIKMLRGGDWPVRSDPRSGVARALGMIGEPTEVIVPALIEVLRDKELRNEDPNNAWRANEAAAKVLGQIGEPAKDAVPALTEALNDSHEDVRRSAVRALKRMGTPEAMKAVKEYGKNR